MSAEAADGKTVPSATAAGARRRRLYGRVYAVLMYTVAAACFGQAVLAGQFMSGSYDALRWHQYGATFTDVLLVCALVPAALLRWRGKGRMWPFLSALGLFAAAQVLNSAGAARLLSLHIPLGVAVIAGAFVVALRVGRADEPAGTGASS
ncbi:uncharacterized membrane protein YcjF (UPF0283 family) [Streptomyces aurantiacus]|uniref:hypothetical protein n=1 Tax=Streptomyces aurantiacus TaxID=47760 RepID=UPI00278ED2DE|nr:hypothetical protein [Streptomyces aurantiacus]MDQ0779109.1 uncharacterized membrane protein YcjF (UPF0283 family) [Streptomyces aurantiacus]